MDSLAPNDSQLDPLAMGDGEGALDMHWNIARFLPEAIQDHFHAIVGEFLLLPWKHEKDEDDPLHGRTPGKFRAMSDSDDSDDENSDSEHAAPGAAVPPTPGAGHNARDLDRLEEDKTIWLEKQLETHFGPKLLRYAQEIQRVLGLAGPRSPPEHQFPSEGSSKVH